MSDTAESTSSFDPQHVESEEGRDRPVEQPTLPDAPSGDSGDSGGDSAGASGEMIGADQPGQASTTVKEPGEWVTGDEPMTGAQRSYLDTLARQAGEQLPADLTKARASEHIDRLQDQTGRGQSTNS